MHPYTVSKHGVVAMTRTLATANDGIMHKVFTCYSLTSSANVLTQAICPAWTDTEIVSSAASTGTGAEKKALTDHIQKMGGLMTPEHVAEGFYRLLTQCSNGATMIVVKDSA